MTFEFRFNEVVISPEGQEKLGLNFPAFLKTPPITNGRRAPKLSLQVTTV